MLNVLLPIILTLLCIAGMIIPITITKSIQIQLAKLNDEIWKFDRLDRNLTDIEAKRWNSLKKQKERLENKWDIGDRIYEYSGIALAPMLIWLLLVLIVLLVSASPLAIRESQIKNQARYRTITTELENPEVRDALNIRMKDIIDDAIEWNADYDCYMLKQKNPWTNWYHPLKALEGVDRIDIDNYI